MYFSINQTIIKPKGNSTEVQLHCNDFLLYGNGWATTNEKWSKGKELLCFSKV